MKPNLVLLCGLIFANAFWHGEIQSDSAAQTIERYRRQGDVFLSRVRPGIYDATSDSDKIIEDKIVYRVTPVPGVNGFAYVRDGQRYIDIPAGMIEIIDWVGTNGAITTAKGKQLCGAEYVQYLGDTIADNTALFYSNLKLREATSPYQFYYSHATECPQVAPDEVNAQGQMNDLRQIMTSVMLQLVLAHEIGHHVHNDVFSNVSWCEQQHRESRADQYSYNVLERMGNPPSVGINLMLIFATVEGFSADDANKNHPAALKRMLAMLETTQEVYRTNPALREGLQSTGNAKQLFDTIDGMETTIRTEVASAKGADPSSVCSE
jgi:hypothetical protein